MLNSNFNVVTSKNLQFFCNLRSKIDLFPWKLHVIYNYCTSPSLLAGGFLADTGIFVLFCSWSSFEFIQFKQKIDTKIRDTLAFKELSFAFAKILQLLLAA